MSSLQTSQSNDYLLRVNELGSKSASKRSSGQRRPFGVLDVNSKEQTVTKNQNKPKQSFVRQPRHNRKDSSEIIAEEKVAPGIEVIVQDSVSSKESSIPSSVQGLFREMSFAGTMSEELEDMLTLKRANHVYDSDDEDESPKKKTRLESRSDTEELRPSLILDFQDRLEENGEFGFELRDYLQ